jgi:hypothetical protein
VRLLDEKTEAMLTKRGHKVRSPTGLPVLLAMLTQSVIHFVQFAHLAVGVHYQRYKGYVAQKEGWWGHQLYKADGRCMLDGVSFNRLNPNSRSSELGLSNDQYNMQTNSFEAIPEEKMFMVRTISSMSSLPLKTNPMPW